MLLSWLGFGTTRVESILWSIAARTLVVVLFLPAAFVAAGTNEFLGEKAPAAAEEEAATAQSVPSRALHRRCQRHLVAHRPVDGSVHRASVHGIPLQSETIDHASIDRRNSIGTDLRL